MPCKPAFALLAALICTSATASGDDEDHNLIGLMGQMQYFSHKLDLAIRHQNRDLVDFYAHEIEETLEATTMIEHYHGKSVGRLTESMMTPAFERFEQTTEAQNVSWDEIEQSFGELIDSCNMCHQATGHGFIKVQRTDVNPYMQSFEPAAR